ncbi:MAG: pyridoxal-phosphate dependent enzyme, partial [Candidatus Nanopelagicales bacterium]
TAGTLMGASQAFRKAGAQVELIALEPASSPILSSGVKGSHRVEGVGLGFVPAQLDPKNYDRVMTIDEETARETSRELARKEGIFAGTSTGMNVAGAIAIAQELGPNDTVVAVACDTGIKYLSEGLFDA